MDDDKKKLVIAGVLIVVALGAIGMFVGGGAGQAPGAEKAEYGTPPPPDSEAVPGTPGAMGTPGNTSETDSERI